jgi:hypothetical protein
MGKKRASPGADTEKNPLGDPELNDVLSEKLEKISDESSRVDIALGTRQPSSKCIALSSNIGLCSGRIPHAGELCSFPGKATRGFEGHPQVLAHCFAEPPHCLDTRCAPPRPGRLELPRGRLVE